jgi:hypothetical protein
MVELSGAQRSDPVLRTVGQQHRHAHGCELLGGEHPMDPTPTTRVTASGRAAAKASATARS